MPVIPTETKILRLVAALPEPVTPGSQAAEQLHASSPLAHVQIMQRAEMPRLRHVQPVSALSLARQQVSANVRILDTLVLEFPEVESFHFFWSERWF
jgi:hypothetical protein